MAAALFSFAAIQLNDPDPLFWVVLYLISACVAVIPQGRLRDSYFWLAVGFCLAGVTASLTAAVDYLGVIGNI